MVTRKKQQAVSRKQQAPEAEKKGPASKRQCVHCSKPIGKLHGGCLYAGPPLAKDRKRTGVSGLVTQADCEGKGVVHTNASLGLLGGEILLGGKKVKRPRMSQPMTEERFEEIVQVGIALVEDGHSEGSLVFELLDEIDRLDGKPPRSTIVAAEYGWSRDSKRLMFSKRTGKG